MARMANHSLNMETYLVYSIEGYDFYDEEAKQFNKVIFIEVIANSEKEAIEEAKKNIEKPLYRITGCYEKAYIK